MNILKIFTKERTTANIGERAAAKFLQRRGYRIMKTNYVAAGHEIDIVAEDKETRAFIEVKTRTEGSDILPRPASAVDKKKQRSIIAAAKVYSAFDPTKKYLRFDVIEVLLSKDKRITKIDFLEDAYRADTQY